MKKTLKTTILNLIIILGSAGLLYGQEALHIDSTGKVGIGTNTPGGQFHIAGSNESNTATGSIILSRSWQDSTHAWASVIYHYFNRNQGVDQLVFGVAGDKGNSPNPFSYSKAKLVIQADGFVGIGTTNPSSALQVNGRIKDQTGFLMPVGSIIAYGGKTAPEGWLICDGSAIPGWLSDLRAVISSSTGQPGQQNYNVPDLSSRFIGGYNVGNGQVPGLIYIIKY